MPSPSDDAVIGRHDAEAALYAGIVAAIVSLVVETPIVWFFGEVSPWVSARMAAAMVLGRQVLSPPTFNLWIVMAALCIHVALSIMYGLILALMLAHVAHRRRPLPAAVIGAGFGLALYFINLHGVAPLLFPWFVALQNGITVFSHLVFGATLGGAYVAVSRHGLKR